MGHAADALTLDIDRLTFTLFELQILKNLSFAVGTAGASASAFFTSTTLAALALGAKAPALSVVVLAFRLFRPVLTLALSPWTGRLSI